MNPAKKLESDAVVANPPFSYRWEPNEALADDFRFKSYGLAPKSAADFAFLLHGAESVIISTQAPAREARFGIAG